MSRKPAEIMRRLLVLVKPLSGIMTSAVVLGVLGQLSAVMITVNAGWAVLHALGMKAPFSFTFLLIMMVVLAALRGLFRYGEQTCNHYIAFRLLAIIRDHVFKALRRLTPAKLEGKDKGDLISVITSDVELLEVFYAHTISPVCIAAVCLVCLAVLIGAVNLKLMILAIACWLAVGIAMPLITSARSGDTGMRIRSLSGELSTNVLDYMRGISEVIQYQAGEEKIRLMNEMTDSFLEAKKDETDLAGRNSADTGALIYAADIMMAAAAYALCMRGEIGFAQALTAVLTMMSSFGPFAALASLGSTLQNTLAAGNRVLDILDEKPLTEDILGKEKTVFESAAMKDVTFAYEAENVLDHFSMEIPKGKITGISGRSGTGKSTILKLLMRFWKVNDGNVEISDRNIETVNTSDLRDMEGYMTQETVMFHDTVRNNLKIASPSATDEELKEACRKASVHEVIESLPQGYDTLIGELGSTLSSGEKQRIGLARVFLHQSELMLLDEPTSSLDVLNEGIILKSLKEESEGRTVVLISHRDSALRISDKVIRMEEQ